MNSPRTGTRLLALALIVLAAAGPALARKKEKGPWRIAAATRNEKKDWVPVETLSFEAQGVRAEIRYLDEPSRKAAFASVTGREIDIFPEKVTESRGWLVFMLELRNGAAADLLFEPGQSRVFSNKTDAEFPLEYAGLYEILTGLGSDAPSVEDAARAVFDRAATLRPGGAVKKLLVFRSPRDDGWKSLEVRLGALHLPAGDLDATFQFRRFEVTP